MDAYVTRLRALARTCSFQNVAEELINQIIGKCHSNKLWKRLLQEFELTLLQAMNTTQPSETVNYQVKRYKYAIEGPGSPDNSDILDDITSDGWINEAFPANQKLLK